MMADKKGIGRLDEKLVSLNIVSGQFMTDLPVVHQKMNTILRKPARCYRPDIRQGERRASRLARDLKPPRRSQEKLTAYLRTGLPT
jgi:hypothetical protein